MWKEKREKKVRNDRKRGKKRKDKKRLKGEWRIESTKKRCTKVLALTRLHWSVRKRRDGIYKMK